MSIFNNAPSGSSAYDSDGNCTCGCEGKPPCPKEDQALVNGPTSALLLGETTKTVVKTGAGATLSGIFTFITAMFSSHETGVNAALWSDKHQQKLNELAYKESQGTLSSQEKQDLQGLRERSRNYRSSLRADTYADSWEVGSLTVAINKFASGAQGVRSITGKIIYSNPATGIQIVYDGVGNYFRIGDTNLKGKRRYLDFNGNVPNNKLVGGKTTGRSQGEYNEVTHFKNID